MGWLGTQLGVFTKRLQKQNNDVEGLSKRFMEDFETLLEDLNDYLKSIQIQDDVKIKEDFFSDVLYTTMNDFFMEYYKEKMMNWII